jgi:hypothetical protein
MKIDQSAQFYAESNKEWSFHPLCLRTPSWIGGYAQGQLGTKIK